jgi:putative transposase
LLKHFLEAVLDAEMDLHLDTEQREKGNRRNGKVSKQVRTSDGVIEVESSRDRSSSFEPQIIRKRKRCWPKTWSRAF